MTKVYLLLKLMFTTFANWWNEPFTPNESNARTRMEVADKVMQDKDETVIFNNH